MKFAFLARILQYDGYGIKTYLEELLREIIKSQTTHEIFLFIDSKQAIPESLLNSGCNIVRVKPYTHNTVGRLIWDHFSVGRACKELDIDALYTPTHVKPLIVPCPVVVVIHDMLYHLFPDDWSWIERIYFKLAVSLLTPTADAIITDSRSTKNDVLHFIHGIEEKLFVVYLGVPDGFFPIDKDKYLSLLEKYSLRKPFILFVGSFHPRKNLLTLIDAFEEIASDYPHDLVIVGNPIWENNTIAKRISSSRLFKRIKWIGYVPQTELPLFYNAADIFVYPSKYEGFGLPVLEALACGCPTITSDVSSMPEVGGDAAIYVSPNDVDQLDSAIRTLLTNSTLKNELSLKSYKRAKEFSWNKTARETISIMESIVKLDYSL
jgi:glycosyltransferase involved in cell wall biosynthesis